MLVSCAMLNAGWNLHVFTQIPVNEITCTVMKRSLATKCQIKGSYMQLVLQINRVIIAINAINAINMFSRLTRLQILIAKKNF